MPLELEKEGLPSIVVEKLGLEAKVHEPDLDEWVELVEKMKNLSRSVTIALVGKYVQLPDAYISINEALKHAGVANDTCVKIKYILAEDLETADNIGEILADADGILVPGGFGDRGLKENKCHQICQENKIPFFGISSVCSVQ